MSIPSSLTHLYSTRALPHLGESLARNQTIIEKIVEDIAISVPLGRRLLVAGSGHSGLFALELYHRAGGVNFVVPIVADYLLPSAGPTVVRALERMPQSLVPIFYRFQPQRGDMMWIASQSGINAASVELALEAQKGGVQVVAFTRLTHSQAVDSRHASKKRLYEVSDVVVDLGGFVGDAAVSVSPEVTAGPLSTLTSVFLGHSILVATAARLEQAGHRCVYTSVNTPTGEDRNRALEAVSRETDFLLR